MHTHHCFAALAQVLQQGDDGAFGQGIHPNKRLIHKINLGILGQGAGQKHPLLLPTTQLANLAAGKIGHTNLLKTLPRQIMLGFAWALHPAQFAIGSHRHHIKRRSGEIPIDAGTLWHIAHQLALLSIRLAKHLDCASHSRQQV